MSDLLEKTLSRVSESSLVFAKSLSPNDTGLTGGHQCGIYIPKQSVKLVFDEPFERGSNHERFAQIAWNDELTTDSRFIYYGVGTRNEYRITRFGRGFDLLKPNHTGDVVVICKNTDEQYYAYVLSTDDEIQGFLDFLSIPITSLGGIVKDEATYANHTEEGIYEDYYIRFGSDFPSTLIMAVSAQEIDKILNCGDIDLSPDDLLLRWIETEYALFKYIEKRHYCFVVEEPAKSLDDFVQTGLEITNRRKARAGKSLEHHLAALFDIYELDYSAQAKTELKKKPDFIFPSEEAYQDSSFPEDELVFLGSKTTCKDRWRQVLSEADRIKDKYLFTLQQGVSPNQLEEMHAEHLTLVVPTAYHGFYPKTDFESVISLTEFIQRVKKLQS